MSGGVGDRRTGGGASAFVAVLVGLTLALQGPRVVQVGRVSAVHWPGDEGMAVALAESADRAGPWPGLPATEPFPVRLVLAPDSRTFDSLTAGRLPSWGAGAAFPGTNTIVLLRDRHVRDVLRHELAHLALRHAVGPVPLWFAEGYASRAAGEWDRFEALRVNWALVRRRVPSFIELNRELRGGAARAEAAYALATTAVLLLERMGEEPGLARLLEALKITPDLDQALRRTHAVTLDQFEGLWQRELKRRYGWLFFLTSFSVFWAVVGGLVVVVWIRKRQRDRARRAALDDGWVLPQEPEGPSS